MPGVPRKDQLSVEAVRAIRRLHAAGEEQVTLAYQFGVSKQTINDIVHRRSWREV